MGLALDEKLLRCVLLDVEGTTTPVDFVYQTLFPYAREHVKMFLQRQSENPEVGEDIDKLRSEHAADVRQGSAPPDWQEGSAKCLLESACRYVHWLMDRDSKLPALKALQGKIWEEGYRSGGLRGDVYADVAPAFLRWHRKRKKIAIFSSGSILAQKRLFETTASGKLSSFIAAHFDTTTGPKRVSESYRRIADALSLQPAEVLFISDTVAELDAAADCGIMTLLCVRAGQSDPAEIAHPVTHGFDDVLP